LPTQTTLQRSELGVSSSRISSTTWPRLRFRHPSQLIASLDYVSAEMRKIHETGMRRRAELYYQQLDALRLVRQQARKELLAEARKHRATKLLRKIPGIGPLRAAHLVALMQTPHRFRTKRQLWTHSGLGLETHDSAQYRVVEGQLQRSKKPVALRCLNDNHNHDLKDIFKGAAMLSNRECTFKQLV
jgi:transposase